MSNWKHAYGWIGHILTDSLENRSDPDDNVVAIPTEIYRRIARDRDSGHVDQRIHFEELGVTSEEAPGLMASGYGFAIGFTHYGTVFVEAEIMAEGQPVRINHKDEYMKAMKEIYGLDLPPCRIMIGCSSEH